MTWRAVVKPTDETVKLLVKDECRDLLGAQLPYPYGPSGLPRRLETLAMWDERELLAAISADGPHRRRQPVARRSAPSLLQSDRVGYRLEAPRPRPRRLRGLCDVRGLEALHVRWDR